MMRISLRLNCFCSNASNLALKSLTDTAARQQVLSAVSTNPGNQQKLDVLANAILSLSSIELQYLVGLQNERALSAGRKLTDNYVFNATDTKSTTIDYLYQKKWIQ